MTLQLEYSCTEAEIKEAQSLHLRQHYGKGSKWRARLVLFAILAAAIALLYFRFKTEVAPKDRVWFGMVVAAIVVAVLVIQRKTRRRTDESVRLEVSERELVFNVGNNRTAIPWPAFGQCFESPNLFALLNRQKTHLYAVPKRAFPDEGAQNWFRSLANQPRSTVESSASEAFIPGRFAGKGVALTVQLKYRDYLTRMLTSWRFKGIALGVFALIMGMFFYSTARPDPDAVVPPGQVFLIMLAIITPMFVVVFFVVAFISWRSEKKFLTPHEVALSHEGVEFASCDGSGILPWTTYKYYLENRWSFFIWNPRGSLWFMFPKRAFASASDVDQCRDLLRSNLKASRWFFF